MKFNGEVVYDAHGGVDKRTPEILKYLEECDGPGIKFKPFVCE